MTNAQRIIITKTDFYFQSQKGPLFLFEFEYMGLRKSGIGVILLTDSSGTLTLQTFQDLYQQTGCKECVSELIGKKILLSDIKKLDILISQK